MDSIVILDKNSAILHIQQHHMTYLTSVFQNPYNHKKHGYSSFPMFIDALIVPDVSDIQIFKHFLHTKIIREFWSWKSLLRKYPWKFIIVKDNIENGFPHTIYDTIILPEHCFLSPNVETIIHERIHVIQKLHPTMFNNLYVKHWNFRKLNKTHLISKSLLLRERINPDGMSHWYMPISKRKILVPLCLLKENSQTLGDVEYVLVEIDLSTRLNKIYNMNTKHFNYFTFFDGDLQNYHPDESSANLLSKLICEKKRSFDTIEKWIRELHRFSPIQYFV